MWSIHAREPMLFKKLFASLLCASLGMEWKRRRPYLYNVDVSQISEDAYLMDKSPQLTRILAIHKFHCHRGRPSHFSPEYLSNTEVSVNAMRDKAKCKPISGCNRSLSRVIPKWSQIIKSFSQYIVRPKIRPKMKCIAFQEVWGFMTGYKCPSIPRHSPCYWRLGKECLHAYSPKAPTSKLPRSIPRVEADLHIISIDFPWVHTPWRGRLQGTRHATPCIQAVLTFWLLSYFMGKLCRSDEVSGRFLPFKIVESSMQ